MAGRSTTTPPPLSWLRSVACAVMAGACSEAHDLQLPTMGMDASLPITEAGMMDSQSAMDTGLDAALDSRLALDASWALCRVPSRDVCGIGNTVEVIVVAPRASLRGMPKTS